MVYWFWRGCSMSTEAMRVCPYCRGSGRSQSSRLKVKVTEALRAGALPAAIDTIYDNHRKGRWPWLTRLDPEGRRGRALWIVVSDAAAWFVADGRPKVAARLMELAREDGGP